MPRDFDGDPPRPPRRPFWDLDRLDPDARARVEEQLADPAALHWSELNALNGVLGRLTTRRAERAAYTQHLFALKWWPQRDDRRSR